MVILLGNNDAIEPQVGTTVDANGEASSSAAPPVEIPGDQILTIEVPNDRPLDAALSEIKTSWSLHSTGQPQWVEGDNQLLVAAVSSTFGCPIGRDDDNEEEA